MFIGITQTTNIIFSQQNYYSLQFTTIVPVSYWVSLYQLSHFLFCQWFFLTQFTHVITKILPLLLLTQLIQSLKKSQLPPFWWTPSTLNIRAQPNGTIVVNWREYYLFKIQIVNSLVLSYVCLLLPNVMWIGKRISYVILKGFLI